MNILALDRNPEDARSLEQDCRTLLAGRLQRFSHAATPEAAATHLDRGDHDVVLVDPAGDEEAAFALLAARADGAAFQAIVVSARTDLALRAFDAGVHDFVPKPVARGRLALALGRVAPRAPAGAAGPGFIAVRRPGRIDLLPVEELLYIEAADKYSELVLANGRRSFHDQCLGRMEAALPRSFVRIHKSYLVRCALVSRLIVRRGSRYFAELTTGQRLPVGRSRYAQIKSRLVATPPPAR